MTSKFFYSGRIAFKLSTTHRKWTGLDFSEFRKNPMSCTSFALGRGYDNVVERVLLFTVVEPNSRQK